MKHRLFVESIAPSMEITGDEFHHAVRVVRIRQGEEVEVFDGRGHDARGRVVEVGREALRIDVDNEIESRESPLRVTLAAAIIQLDKFELVLQKATELGVASIVPLLTDRIEVRAERYRGKSERWAKIVLEAVKQSGRSVVPRVDEPTRFDDAVQKSGLRFFFDAGAEADDLPERADEVTLLIGPEGGWTEREIALARESRCVFQRLGPRRLRAETAAICALSIVAARYGDI
ncbi:MAG TPA: RsmE family RNA methyltransferase [Thermoanaerobaculia bacterium]